MPFMPLKGVNGGQLTPSGLRSVEHQRTRQIRRHAETEEGWQENLNREQARERSDNSPARS